MKYLGLCAPTSPIAFAYAASSEPISLYVQSQVLHEVSPCADLCVCRESWVSKTGLTCPLTWPKSNCYSKSELASLNCPHFPEEKKPVKLCVILWSVEVQEHTNTHTDTHRTKHYSVLQTDAPHQPPTVFIRGIETSSLPVFILLRWKHNQYSEPGIGSHFH